MADGLNPVQMDAVRYLDGPCLVIAGAGSGKTRVITHKIRHLIDSGIDPGAIGAITFTNKAAQEMSERLGAMLKLAGSRKPTVCTFHSLGLQMLRQDGRSVGLKSSFSIIDADDAAGIIAQLINTTDRKVIRATQSRVSLWKNALLEPEEAAAAARDELEHAAARAYRDYVATLTAYQSVDFDDLIRLPVRMLREDAQIAERWQQKLRYTLIDEYQDTNAAQYELLRAIVGARAAFTAVGDDDQSIYGWRGATLDNLRRLQTDYPRLHVIKLEQNYRSSRTILTAANALISHNPKLHDKRLWSEHGVGDPILVLPQDDEEAEAESVAMRLQAMKIERGSKWADYAVLYRSNHQARVIEQAFRNQRIPYAISGGQSFFERAEIRDVCAYLRLLSNDDDDPAFIRALTTPKRGVGAQTLHVLGAYAGDRNVALFAALFETGIEQRLAPRLLTPLREFGAFVNRFAHRAAKEPARQVLDDLLNAIGYRDHLYQSMDDKQAANRWQNVVDFVEWVGKRAEDDRKTLVDVAQLIALITRLDDREKEADAVRLSTIHASKGLEYPHVFLIGVEEGLLPHTLPDSETAADEADLGPQRVEEERRLMYVAVTRAQRTLTMTWCRERRRARAVLTREPSRFIGEMQLDAAASQPQQVAPDTAKQRLAALKGLLRPAVAKPQS